MAGRSLEMGLDTVYSDGGASNSPGGPQTSGHYAQSDLALGQRTHSANPNFTEDDQPM